MKSDLKKAREIVAAERDVWVSGRGELRENIAKAVARGIMLGRREGLEAAVALINNELGKLPPSSE